MPTLKSYTDRPGYYLKSNVDGQFITLQTTPTASRILEDLGYAPGSSVPLYLVHELSERGEIYTHADRESVPGDASAAQLTDEERSVIRSHTDGDAAGAVDDAIVDLVSRVEDDRERERLLGAIRASPAVKPALRSLAGHPDPISELSVVGSSLGVETRPNGADGVALEVVDERFDPEIPWDFALQLRIRSETERVIDARVRDSYVTWWRERDEGAEIGVDDAARDLHRTALEEAHRDVFSHAGSPGGGIGFDVRDEPILAVQRFFLFLDNYGLRPDPRGGGHRQFSTASELREQHIWAKVTRTASSKGNSSTRMVTNELIDFTVQYDGGDRMLFVEVPSGERVDHVTGVRPESDG